MRIHSGDIIMLGWLAIIGLIGFMFFKAIENDNQREAARPAQRLYLMTHPEIIGTNEVGEVIKRYTILQGYGAHYIYELGETKTTIIPKVKGQIDVIVEKTK
jgi:hypothetical protein